MTSDDQKNRISIGNERVLTCLGDIPVVAVTHDEEIRWKKHFHQWADDALGAPSSVCFVPSALAVREHERIRQTW